jgi:hypothetical protein
MKRLFIANANAHTESSENAGLDPVSLTDEEWQVWVGLLDAIVVLSNELPVGSGIEVQWTCSQ